MSIKYMKQYIEAFNQFKILIEELMPMLTDTPLLAADLSDYINAFCYDMILRVDFKSYSGLDFINNITMTYIPEVDEITYSEAIENHTIDYYDNILFGGHKIVDAISMYDKFNNTALKNCFIEHMVNIAIAFSKQEPDFESPIMDFADYFKSNINKAFSISINQEQKQTCTKTVQVKNIINPVRIIIPAVLLFICIVMGIAEVTVMYIVAIFPLVFLVKGFRHTDKQCPECNSVNSFTRIDSELISTKKVKVKRILGSGYFRTSRNHTVGLREVFVSADENHNKDTYRCRVCGAIYVENSTDIDDGIR